MARLKGVYKPSDYAGALDDVSTKDVDELFEQLCPGQSEPALAASQAPWAILASQSPRLPLMIAKLGYFLKDTGWSQNLELRELAFQTVNYHFKCDFSFQAHLSYARESGLGVDRVAAIPYWKETNLFNDEQRLVIEYTLGVVRNDVPIELFSRVVDRYGERGTIEFTACIAFWSFWAVFNNAFRPEFDSEDRSRNAD